MKISLRVLYYGELSVAGICLIAGFVGAPYWLIISALFFGSAGFTRYIKHANDENQVLFDEIKESGHLDDETMRELQKVRDEHNAKFKW